MEVYAENEPCTVKMVIIEPGECLSLQFHNHRSQLYIPLENVGLEWSDIPVPDELTDRVDILQWYKDHCNIQFSNIDGNKYFPIRTIHRAYNLSKSKRARFLEVAYGHNDEADIVRLEDRYGRA